MSLQDIYEAVKENALNNHYDDSEFRFDEAFYMERLQEVML